MSKLIAILVTMKQRKRLIVRNVVSHCYQRTAGSVVIFYNISDYLVFFTIFCTTARKYKIKILSLCLMADHIHICISEERKGELSAFVREYSKLFSRVHNRTCHTQGNLFESPFGSAPKFGDKKARANLIYIGNNAPERRLCRNAEEYRWNFLAYAVCTHPFSKSFSAKDSSPIFRNIRKVVTTSFQKGKYLTYEQLQFWFKKLNREAKEQLTDFIISTYNIIDYPSAIRFFDSYENMLAAMHSNTGSEHDLNEVFIGKSDTYYASMSSLLLTRMKFMDVHDVLGLPIAEKFQVFLQLNKYTDAFPEQIAAFLRMPLSRAEK